MLLFLFFFFFSFPFSLYLFDRFLIFALFALALSQPLVFNANVPYTVPKPVFDLLEAQKMGDYHTIWHMSRRYYVLGADGRAWLDAQGVAPAPLQEGDDFNGVDFL